MKDVNETLDLEVSRRMAASPERVWSALTEPMLVKQWWAPKPHTTPEMVIEARPGGRLSFRMVLADGPEVLQEGCVLLVEPLRRLVWTDGLAAGFRPKADGFVTADVTLAPEGSGTLYRVRVLHKDRADLERHREKGFETAWRDVAAQLEEVARTA